MHEQEQLAKLEEERKALTKEKFELESSLKVLQEALKVNTYLHSREGEKRPVNDCSYLVLKSLSDDKEGMIQLREQLAKAEGEIKVLIEENERVEKLYRSAQEEKLVMHATLCVSSPVSCNLYLQQCICRKQSIMSTKWT